MAERHALEAPQPASADNTTGLLAVQRLQPGRVHGEDARHRQPPGQDRTAPSPLTGSQVRVMSPKAADVRIH